MADDNIGFLDYKSLLGILSVIIVCANHFYYLTLAYLRRIRPHAFTLLVYLIVTCSVAAGMYGEGDRGAAIRMAFPAPLYILMLFLTCRQGVDYIKRIDIAMLVLSVMAMPVWMLTESPRAAIGFLAVVEGFGMVPAFRKAYDLPWEDSALSPAISATAMLLALAAVQDPSESWATALYLLYWVMLCTTLTVIISFRRSVIKKAMV